MGLESDQWPDIQKQMLDKMNKNPLYSSKKYYLNVWEGRENLKLSLEHKSGSAPPQFWLTLPAHGHLMADTYQRPVILFSKDFSTLYLPLSHPPTSHPPICLILVGAHFISFTFDEAELLPYPILDCWWDSYATEAARPWKELVKPNLDLGDKVLYVSVRNNSTISKEPVNVE